MSELEALRRKIDKLDDELIKILNQRFSTVGKIMKFKREKGLPKEDKKREKEILNKAGKLKPIFEAIFKYSKRN